MKVASSPEAGLLGSSWVIILRCLSLLEALQVHLIDRLACTLSQNCAAHCSPCRCSSANALHACVLEDPTCKLRPSCTNTDKVKYSCLQSRLPLAPKEAAQKVAPGRQVSAARAPLSGGHAADGVPEQSTDDGQLQRGQSRAARASGLGRFLSRMGMAGEAVAPEV